MKVAIPKAERLYWNIFETASDGMLVADIETGNVLAANPAAAEMHDYTRAAFCTLRLHSLIHPKSLPFFADFAQVIQQGGLFEIQAQHIRRDNSLITIEWRAVAINYQERGCALALLRDVSKRVQAERQLKQRMDARAHEQATLLDISQTLASTLELHPGMVLEQLGMLIKYSLAGLFTLEDSTLVAQAFRGKKQLEKSVPIHIRLNGKKVLTELFNDQHPIRIADIWSNDPSAKFLRTLLENGSAVLLEGAQSWMWVPLAVKKRIIGGIGFAHSDRNFFTPHDADLAMTIANQVAITLVNAELNLNAQTLAVLQERQRLAQNLHDAVNQSLFSAGLIAEVLPRLWERNPDEARRSLEDLRRLNRGALAEMRALLAELRPTTLTDTELSDLLRLLGNAYTGRTNMPVFVQISGAGSLPAEIQVALYRICQEALNNIAKHAKASRVDIDVQHGPRGLQLTIRDDGCGFDPDQLTLSGHYGLSMMRERAEAVGADFAISSQLGKGTEITIYWGELEG